MVFGNAEIVSVDVARALVAPALARHMAGADLTIALDHELILGDAYDRRGVLMLSDGAVIEGDLLLDHDTAVHDGVPFRGVIAQGALTVRGDIVNENCDGGPFLVTLGTLGVRHILKGGAPMMAASPVVAAGTIYCAYNHGCFRAWGGVAAQAVIIDDHLHEITGPVDAIKVVIREDDLAVYLVPELLWEEEDGSVGPMDDLGDEILTRIRAGTPVVRPDAPRLPHEAG